MTLDGYRALSCQDALRQLGGDEKNGLSQAEAGIRLESCGPNEVPEARPKRLALFLGKFWGLSAWMLELTLVLALFRRRYLDASILAALLLLNGLLGFFQERRASTAVELLKRRLQVRVRTLRQGAWELLDASGLVPGDILRLRMGDFVPADAKLLTGSLELDLSSVNGESSPLNAGPGDLLLSGAVVKNGEGEALVLLTGKDASYGRTIQLVQTAAPKAAFDAVVTRVLGWLLLGVALVLALSAGVSLAQGRSLLEILPLMLILLVSAVPVALPAMFTLTLTLGSMELTRRGVLVTRLSASEDAARMDLLCCDKTGTLTASRLALVELAPRNGFSPDELLRYGTLCSRQSNHDPIDAAFIKAGLAKSLDNSAWLPKSFTPFSPLMRRTEAVMEHEGREIRAVKGALEAVLALCEDCGDEQLAECRSSAAIFAERGYRCLAVAIQESGGPFRLAGLAALEDPPRPESRLVLNELKSLGVRVIMLTGDALPVARELALRLGLGARVRSLKKGPAPAGLPDLESVDGLAEIYPEDKFLVVRRLQETNHVVGMTGDGVNDAPALKQAEVGVAVSNATDAAKGAAGVVLTEEGLSSLPGLVRVGRSIHQRMETWILNKIVKTIQIVLFVVAAFLATGQFIVTTFDMVLLLFLVDFVTLALATDHAKGAAAPARWDIEALVRLGFVLGLACVAESSALLWIGWRHFGMGQAGPQLQSFGFEILFYFGLFTVLVVRERGPFWTSLPSAALLMALILDAVLVAELVTHGMPGLAPLPANLTLFVVAYAGVFALLVNDRIKLAVLGRPPNPPLA